ncbi:carbohydrate kinase family protein [Siculibacillus lacustris]|uniref:Carbohydrate kinase family protein n=1 Tax=Siculibacillus lacustris TaxID=1549641 RepID=A0A4Q9VJB7_9HYPH|nr:carbohydrate kinase family protein [Siculibacillus lacustris]TBW34489.1 carbohydrate kinase family protein [Siculibacillus lacustris]
MTSPRAGVVAAGSWIVDRNKAIDHWPAEETVAEIVEERHEGGGNGFNVGIDLARLGLPAPIWAMGVVGDDAEGRFLRTTAQSRGIDTSRLAVSDAAPTSATDAMSSVATGRRTFFHAQGVHALMSPADFDFDGLPARYLHLGLPGLHRRLDGPCDGEVNGWVAILKKAGRAGLVRNIEVASITPERLAAVVGPCLPHLDLLVVNDREIGAFAGIETVVDGVTDVAACRRALAIVLERGAMDLAVAHFPTGALALARDGSAAERPSVAVPASAVVGTNGAGDAFAAGVLYALHEGRPLDGALALGHAAAAASVRAITTTGSVETAEACLALAERWGWRATL